MQLEIPFFYRSTVDVLDGPKEVSRVVFDTTFIGIREAAGAEAPIALSFEDAYYNWATRNIRIHDGEFYGGYMTVGGRKSTRKVSAMKPRSCGSSPPLDLMGFLVAAGAYPFKTEWQYGLETMKKWWSADLYDYPEGVVSPLYVVKSHDDTRKKRLAEVARAAEGLLSVDGMLHFRTAEPTLLVSDGSLGVVTDFGLPRKGADIYTRRLRTDGRLQMSMRELDRASERAFADKGVEPGPLARDIEVHIPEAFSFDSAAFQAVMVAKEIVRVMEDRLGEMSACEVTNWSALREGVSGFEQDDGDCALLVGALRELAPAAIGISPRLGRSFDDLDYVVSVHKSGAQERDTFFVPR
jgi:hypothetical protein